jgi:hypothetical protein
MMSEIREAIRAGNYAEYKNKKLASMLQENNKKEV